MLKIIIVALALTLASPTVIIQQVTITQKYQTFTIPFATPFASPPHFAYYIQSGRIKDASFSLMHETASTHVTNTQLSITLLLHIDNLIGGDQMAVSILITDQNSHLINFGVVQLDLANFTLTFSGFSLEYQQSVLEVYPLAFPMMYTKTENTTTKANSQIILNLTQRPLSDFSQGTFFFSYVYLTNAYSATRVASLFPYINQLYYGYVLSYSTFTYTPATNYLFVSLKTYSSTRTPYFQLQPFKDFATSGSTIDQFIIGYYNVSGGGVTYSADVFMINTTNGSCSQGQFLHYVTYFSSLPLDCTPCHLSCTTCLAPSLVHSSTTDQNSCMSCPYLRYYKQTNKYHGSCPCYLGLQTDALGNCLECSSKCLTFKVFRISSTNQTNFLLYFSYPQIVLEMALDENLVVSINGKIVSYKVLQKKIAIYKLAIGIQDMAACQGNLCSIQFLFNHPEYVLNEQRSQALSHNNYTLFVDDFVSYNTIVPQQVQQAFKVLGLVVSGSFGGGYTSLLKMLFQMEQMIDFHKYVNLTLPVIFSQLVQSLSSFKFMDLTILLPEEPVQKIKNFPANDLDQMGPPKLMYYQEGVNFVKNIITGIISCIVMLCFNYLIYFILKKIPCNFTNKFAKKLRKRKIITVHDTLEQLVLPVFFYSITQMFYILITPQLSWVYGFASFLATATIIAPFLLCLYVYFNRQKQQMIDVYQDLLQDNDISRPVTFVYYIFNYYRKIFFGLCLTNTIPGLVQIYLLITINISHLSFTIYLVVNEVYRSKSKIIIKLINTSSMIILQALIVVYNVNNYTNLTNVNIGMACFYIAIIATIVGIIDAIIKIIDTITQKIGSKKKVTPKQDYHKKPVLQPFRKEIVCHLGQQLPSRNLNPKEIKFRHDKQLMQNTFEPNDQDIYGSDGVSQRLQNADQTKPQLDQPDIVFIDDDWTDVYPEVKERDPIQQFRRQKPQVQEPKQLPKGVELYEIPADVQIQAKNLAKRRSNLQRQRRNKYDVQDFMQLPSKSTDRDARGQDSRKPYLQVKPINQSQEQISEFDPNQR